MNEWKVYSLKFVAFINENIGHEFVWLGVNSFIHIGIQIDTVL